jgi:hypothetical protein
MAYIPKAKPRRRAIDLRSLCFALDGPELPYPVYIFSGHRVKIERPGHNPFRTVDAIEVESGEPLTTEGGVTIEEG